MCVVCTPRHTNTHRGCSFRNNYIQFKAVHVHLVLRPEAQNGTTKIGINEYLFSQYDHDVDAQTPD